MLKFCFIVLLASVVLSWSPRVQAQDDAAFDSNVSKGVENYKARKYNAAIKYFRDAYAIKPDPTLIFNIARSYERLGKIEDALANYQAYVDAPGTTTEDRADVLNRIKALKAEQAARDAALNADEPTPPPLPAESKTNGSKTEETRTEPRSETVRARVEPDPKTSTPVAPKSGLVVIVNKANPVQSVTKSQLADMYFGRTSSWPNGARARPFARPSGTEAAKLFFSSEVGIDAAKYSQHWQQKQLSGAGLAPASIETAAAVIKAVAGNAGAIGFLAGGEIPANLDSGVRIVELR